MKLSAPAKNPLSNLTGSEILLRKMATYVSWEVAGALACLRLAALPGHASDERVNVAPAIRQLESLAECASVLTQHPRAKARVDQLLTRTCRSLADWRLQRGQIMILKLARITCSGEQARVLCLIAADLVSSSLRHALEVGGTRLEVRLERGLGEVSLVVVDNGPRSGAQSSIDEQADHLLTSELVRRMGGRIDIHHDSSGTITIVTLPKQLPRRRG